MTWAADGWADRRVRYGGLAAAVAGIAGIVLLENLGGRMLYEILLRAPGIDKVLHLVQYTVIGAAIWGCARLAGLAPRTAGIVAVSGTLAIGIMDELAQGRFAARSMELADLVVDAAGAAAALALVGLSGRRRLQVSLVAAAVAVTAGLAYRTHVELRDYNRGLLYERQRDFVAARGAYQRALAAGHRSAGLYNSLAWVEVESGAGSPAAAVRYAEQGLALRPDNADLLDTYGWALHHAGRTAEALPVLERAYARSADIYCVHYHLGVVLLALGRPTAAREQFSAQVRRFPGAVESQRARAALGRLTAADARTDTHP